MQLRFFVLYMMGAALIGCVQQPDPDLWDSGWPTSPYQAIPAIS